MFKINIEGIKRFFSEPSVKKSFLIFGGIALVMGIIILISVLSGCGTSKYYTKVDKISLIVDGVGHHGNFKQLYMVVANPTSERRHFYVRCCNLYNNSFCMKDINVVVNPRSDKRVLVSSLMDISCQLVHDPLVTEL